MTQEEKVGFLLQRWMGGEKQWKRVKTSWMNKNESEVGGGERVLDNIEYSRSS